MEAAERLFAAEPSLPTAARLAEEAGLAKGTLYLYFESREAVYAALLLARWTQSLVELEESLSEATGASAAETALEAFVTLIESKPALMLLDAMLPQLRKGMSEESRQNFSQTLASHMNRVGKMIEHTLGLEKGGGFRLIVRSQAFARGLWQACDADEGQSEETGVDLPRFSSELREAIAQYWCGVLVRRDKSDP